jgi:hypothetical protein
MPTNIYDFRSEEEEFGPGTALVLSLFAVLLLIASLVWSQGSQGQHTPVTMAVMAEEHSFFDPGRAVLGDGAKKEIKLVIRRARNQNQFNHIQVIGYASPEGTGNRELSAQRARAVRDYMVSSLGVPDECVIVATFSDSHSPSLKGWLNQGNSLEAFRRQSAAQQKQIIPEATLAGERKVAILGVYHQDSICRLDKIP